MIYNVAQLLNEPTGSTRRYSAESHEHIASDHADVLPYGEIHMLRTDRGILIRALLEARLRMICSRCLEGFPHQFTLSLEEEFLPTVDVASGQPARLPEGSDVSLVIDEHHTLDLTEAGRQYCLTNQPMKPLCRQDCLGICQTCGKNKNDDLCACGADNPDPRWGPLANLLELDRR